MIILIKGPDSVDIASLNYDEGLSEFTVAAGQAGTPEGGHTGPAAAMY